MSYLNRLSQNVTADANNSSTGNLAASSTFTGTATSTLGVAGIQVSLKTDQNCTVYVEQSPDSTNWDIVDTYNYYASINNFGITVQAINSYVRVRVTNIGSSTTTYFRLQTALCPIVEAVPRSLDDNGHLLTAVHAIQDEYGFGVENTPTGEMRMAEPVRLAGTSFDLNGNAGAVDTNFWTPTTANGATVVQSNSQVILTSGTNSAGSAQLNTIRRARYIGGSSMVYRAVIQLGDTGTASNYRRWGVAYNSTMPGTPSITSPTVVPTDGAYFQLNGTTFSIVTVKAGTSTVVNSGSFNGTLGGTYSPGTSATTYEIYWTNSKVYFTIGGKILHTVSATSSTWAATMSPYVYMDNVNTGNTTSVTLSCRVATIRRLGKLETQSIYKNISGAATTICKYGPGRLNRITFNSATNGTATIYDNTAASGSLIATVTTNGLQGHVEYNLPFFNGLTIVTSAAGHNITAVYE